MKREKLCCSAVMKCLHLLSILTSVSFVYASFIPSFGRISPTSTFSSFSTFHPKYYHSLWKRRHPTVKNLVVSLTFSTKYSYVNQQQQELSKKKKKKNTKKKDHYQYETNSHNKNTKIHKNLNTKKEKTVVILYHKPAGVITSHSNNDAVPMQQKHNKNDNNDVSSPPLRRKTVYEDIMSMKGYVPSPSDTPTLHHQQQESFEEATNIQSKLHAIGRLDVDTTGLLLLTNDGALLHHVTNPTSNYNATKAQNDGSSVSASKNISKTYEAVIMGHHTLSSPAIQTLLLHGVDLGAKSGGMTQPADDVTILSHPTAKSTLVSITISEGKNRQIRKMFHSVGSGVMSLHRCCIGGGGNGITLGDLKEGEWRILGEKEVLDALDWKIRELDDETYVEKKRKRSGGLNRDKLAARKKRRRRR